MLQNSGTMHGRYSKDDLREQFLRLPHAFTVGLRKDLLLEEYKIVPDDLPLEAWVNDKVVGMAERGGAWDPEAFWLESKRIAALKSWNSWVSLDTYFMPKGLEPALFMHNERYSWNETSYYLCEFRFMPMKSFEYSRPMPSSAS